MKTRLLLLSSLLALASVTKAQWLMQNSNFAATSRGINCIVTPNDSTVWAIGYDGSVASAPQIQEFVLTTDSGTTWTPGTVTDPNVSAFGIGNISAIDGDTAYISMFDPNGADPNQGIYKTTDKGVNWTRLAGAAYGAGSFPDVIYFKDAQHGVAIGDPLGGYFEVYTTSDCGATWVRTPNTGNQLSPNVSSEYGLTNSYFGMGDTIWIGTDHGRVLKSMDLGLTWTAATTPFTSTTTTASSVSNLAFRDGSNGLIARYNATTKKFDYCKSTDGGATWTTVVSTGANYGSDFCAVPGTSIYVSVGAAYSPNFKGSSMSSDDGATWQLIEDTTAVAQRTAVTFYDATLGYAGGFNDATNPAINGVARWTGPIMPFVGINNPKAISTGITVYPNPTAGFLSVALTGFAGKKATVTVYNTMGEKVYDSTTTYETPVFTKHIDLTTVPSGVYIISINDGTKAHVQRIIKQ